MVDEVLTQTQQKRRFRELRMARIATADRYRYVSGVGDGTLGQVSVLLVRTLHSHRSLLLLAAGTRWIRTFFLPGLDGIANTTMVRDWSHAPTNAA